MFGMDRTTVIQAVNGISMQALERHAPKDIVLVGMAVERLLADYCRDHPEDVPKMESRGLLSSPELIFIPSFELALHLQTIQHPAIVALERLAGGVPILLAYLAVESLPAADRHDIGWESALQYAVRENGVRLHRAQQLQDAVTELEPLAKHGKLFKGRKPGSVSPLRKAIRKELKLHPDARPANIWASLAARPPKDMTFHDSARLGKYIETVGEPDTGYRRFANIVSLERKSK